MDQVRKTIRCDEAEVDGSGVTVAVLDTGADVEHPDLAECIDVDRSRGFGLFPDFTDRHGHGTHVAGIIAGSGRASEGQYRGIAPGSSLIILRIAGEGGGLASDAVRAVEYAMECGADIINYSMGHNGYSQSPPWKWPQKLSIRETAFRAASEQGILCVAAAGNDGPTEGTINQPATLPEVLCVGAITHDLAVARSSSRGPIYIDPGMAKGGAMGILPGIDQPLSLTKPDVVAPGGDLIGDKAGERRARLAGVRFGPVSARSSKSERLLPVDSSRPEFLYTRIAGTSQATAVVTGLAALLLQLGRQRGFDWGGNQGQALAALLRKSARLVKGAEVYDAGHGVLIWPFVLATLMDCLRNPQLREAVLGFVPRLID